MLILMPGRLARRKKRTANRLKINGTRNKRTKNNTALSRQTPATTGHGKPRATSIEPELRRRNKRLAAMLTYGAHRGFGSEF
jgi:hypothetical protein